MIVLILKEIRCSMGEKSKAFTFQSSVTGEVVPLQLDMRLSRMLKPLAHSMPCNPESKANEL